jgi:putative endonuclease
VYIFTNSRHSVLYTGVTGDLKKRVWEHTEKVVDGFTKHCNVNKLVYYETCEDILGAIAREKQIKAGSRAKKVAVINSVNPEQRDLYDSL